MESAVSGVKRPSFTNADETVLEEATVEETRNDLVDAAVEATVSPAESLVVNMDETVVVILKETVEG
jgi:hypothetical protein